jgi:carbamoyl-phosphate synthase large subunit
MIVIRGEYELEWALEERLRISGAHPLLVDEFLENAVEYDVDAIGDGEQVVIGGVMQHVEAAGVHSGDSTCWLPARDADPDVIATLIDYTRRIGLALPVRGLMNVQYAVRDGTVYALEVNPRASRTVPYVSKTVGVPLARLGALVMVGATLAELGLVDDPVPLAIAVKAPALPFQKFPGVDPVLGPEMKSTGEVIGMSADPAEAYRKALLGVGVDLRVAVAGNVLLSLADRDIERGGEVAERLRESGAALHAPAPTHAHLAQRGVSVESVDGEGAVSAVDQVRRGDFSLIVSTARGGEAAAEDVAIRRAALWAGVPCLTSIEAAEAAAEAAAGARGPLDVCSLQRWEALARC